jgi:hypothetical protein
MKAWNEELPADTWKTISVPLKRCCVADEAGKEGEWGARF